MTTTKLFRVIVPVTDIERATRFYAQVLLSDGERVSPGRHYFDCGGTILACYDPVADGDEMGQGWRLHENQYVYLAVSDLAAVRQRVVKAGGRDVTEIEAMPWGERLFYALDPCGARLSFVDAATLFRGSGQ